MMEKISLQSFCITHQVEQQFVESLYTTGLITVVTEEEEMFIEESQLPELEKLTRLHQDLNINYEGIEALAHLLKKVETMREEIRQLKNRLRFYE
jgi:chaperone modulatory protein CbpM